MPKKKILFISKGEQSASTRYRAYQYFPALANAGWHAAHMGLYEGSSAKLKILTAARKVDVVVLLRHGLAFPFLPLLHKSCNKLIFDFDDAVFLKPNGNISAVRAKRFDNTVALCDQVWAGNNYLAERANKSNQNVIVLPTAIEMVHYQGESTKPTDTIDLVWIGSTSTSKYLKEILPALEHTVKREPRLRLKIIADFSLQSDTLSILAMPWQQDREITELQSAHIGIAPMPDTPWTRGKCALKVLQYMASRLPVISSPAGVNGEVIDHDKNGLLVSSQQQWADAIVSLANSPEQRKAMGDNGYSRCHQDYSLQSCSEKMLSQLNALID